MGVMGSWEEWWRSPKVGNCGCGGLQWDGRGMAAMVARVAGSGGYMAWLQCLTGWTVREGDGELVVGGRLIRL